MEEEKLFRIGDVAKMFHISTGTLRHYERMGIVVPEYIEEKSGYRYYSIRQFEVLNTIRYPRVLDMPLEQIADFLANRDIQVIEEKLQKQKITIAEKKRQLEIIERKIDHRIRQIKDAAASRLDEIHMQQTKACRIVWIRDSLTIHSHLDLEYAIRRLEKDQPDSLTFLGKVGVGISKEKLENRQLEAYDRVFLVLDDEENYQGEVEQLPETRSVSIRFCGGHQEAEKYYQKLLIYIEEHHLKIAGFSREITLIDYGITNDTGKFVTEILIPVATI